MRGFTGTVNYTVEEFNLNGESVTLELEVEYSYSPGTPDVHYLPNGDPGYPGDPPEVEWTAKVKDITFAEVQNVSLGTWKEWITDAQKLFDAALETDQDLVDSIEEKCFEDAADKEGDEPEREPDFETY
jgi:hypothetical protein